MPRTIPVLLAVAHAAIRPDGRVYTAGILTDREVRRLADAGYVSDWVSGMRPNDSRIVVRS